MTTTLMEEYNLTWEALMDGLHDCNIHRGLANDLLLVMVGGHAHGEVVVAAEAAARVADDDIGGGGTEASEEDPMVLVLVEWEPMNDHEDEEGATAN